jgi:hypothetical protein
LGKKVAKKGLVPWRGCGGRRYNPRRPGDRLDLTSPRAGPPNSTTVESVCG